MGSGGAFADYQLRGDLLVGAAAGDQREDLALAWGELVRRGRIPGRAQRGHQPSGQGGVERQLAVVGGAHRGDELVGIGVLEQVTGGAGIQGGVDAVLFHERGQRYDLHLGVAGADLPRRLDSVHRVHLEVHEHDVWPQPLGAERHYPVQRLTAVSCLADDLDPRLGPKEAPEALADHLVVIDDQQSDFRRLRHRP